MYPWDRSQQQELYVIQTREYHVMAPETPQLQPLVTARSNMCSSPSWSPQTPLPWDAGPGWRVMPGCRHGQAVSMCQCVRLHGLTQQAQVVGVGHPRQQPLLVEDVVEVPRLAQLHPRHPAENLNCRQPLTNRLATLSWQRPCRLPLRFGGR